MTRDGLLLSSVANNSVSVVGVRTACFVCCWVGQAIVLLDLAAAMFAFCAHAIVAGGCDVSK